MRKTFTIILAILIFILLIQMATIKYSSPTIIHADDNCTVDYCLKSATNACNPDCYAKLSTDLRHQYDLSVAATKPLEGTLVQLQNELASIKQKLIGIQAVIGEKKAELKVLQKEIAKGDKELSHQEDVLAARVRLLYKRNFLNNSLVLFLNQAQALAISRELVYRHTLEEKDKKVIVKTVISLKDLDDKKQQAEDLKTELELESVSLAKAQAESDKQAEFFAGEIAKAKSYQSTLSSQIASLTQRQQDIISGRIESLNLPSSLGAGPLYCTDDRNVDPGFSPAFAFFTYGIPHRVGLNQYGAYGRAQAGEKYDEILHAYFNFDSYQNIDTNTNIKVNDSNEMNSGNIIWSGSLNDYVKRVYEVPSSWPVEALKAQIIAIRSYVLSSTNNGAMSICANQYCQVFKTDPKGGDWDRAVDDTQGNVMIQGGQPIKAWFSSTDGGYTFTAADIWGSDRSWTKRLRDTNGDVNSFSDLSSKAYDRDSPCFYSAQGYRKEYNKSAWLKSEEVADIVNVILLARKDSSTRDHLYQPDKSNPAGTDTWDANRVKQELGGSAYHNISDITVTGKDFGTGRTTQVTVKGDAGEQTFEGAEFSNYFNLRSPANILIVGPLFNIEKK